MASNILNYISSNSNTYATNYDKYYPTQYFSGVDCSLFLNMGAGQEPVLIDEITELEFTMYETVMPVYGYASYTADAMVHGARMINGHFCINMRPGDYLHELVNDLPNASGNTSLPVNSISRPDPTVDPDGYELWSAQQVQQYWGSLAAIKANSITPDLRSTAYFTQNNFTMLLIYGSVDSTDFSRNVGRIRTINNVNLLSVSQRIDLSGVNIQEVFSFQATDMNTANRTGSSFNG